MKITSDPNEAFHQADVIFMLGAMPRREGMLRKDLLHANAAIFKAQGQVIDKVAKKSVKVMLEVHDCRQLWLQCMTLRLSSWETLPIPMPL